MVLRSSASLRSRQGVETEGEAGQGAALRGQSPGTLCLEGMIVVQACWLLEAFSLA